MTVLSLDAIGDHALNVLCSKRVPESCSDDGLEVVEGQAREKVGLGVATSRAVLLDLSAATGPRFKDESEDVDGKEGDKGLELFLVGLVEKRHGADVDGGGDKGEEVEGGDLIVGSDVLLVLKVVQSDCRQLWGFKNKREGTAVRPSASF